LTAAISRSILEHQILIRQAIREEFEDGRYYYELHGRTIALPSDVHALLSRESAQFYAQTVFSLNNLFVCIAMQARLSSHDLASTLSPIRVENLFERIFQSATKDDIGQFSCDGAFAGQVSLKKIPEVHQRPGIGRAT